MKKLNCLAVFILSFLLTGCAGGMLYSKKVRYIEVNSRDCYVCQRMEPLIDEMVKTYGNIIDISTYSDTSDSGSEIVKKYNIKKYPANIFMDGNGTVFFRYEGLLDKFSFKGILRDHGVIAAESVSSTAAPAVK
jgi:thiol-disulfide isomerase/thioredoxin